MVNWNRGVSQYHVKRSLVDGGSSMAAPGKFAHDEKNLLQVKGEDGEVLSPEIAHDAD